jgi:hypothetical protein
MTNDKLWGYINKNLNKIKILEIEINKEEDNWGDEYHVEDSSEFTFILFSDEYKVGYYWCLKNGKWIDPVDVYNILENYQQLNRDFKLKQIL